MRENDADGNIDSLDPYDESDFEDYEPDEYDEAEDLEQEEAEEEDEKKNPLGIDIPENWQVFLYRLLFTAITVGVWLMFILNAPVETGLFPVIVLGLVITAVAVKVLMMFGAKQLIPEFKDLMAEVKEKKNNAPSVDDE